MSMKKAQLSVNIYKIISCSAYNSLIIGPRGLQCETNLQEIMHCESSNVVKFDMGPFFKVKQG